MNDNNLDGPYSLKNKPTGIQRIRRSPLVMVFVIFAVIVVMQIFNLSKKKQMRIEKQKKATEQAATAGVSGVIGSQWFEDKIYDKPLLPVDPIKTSLETEGLPTHGALGNNSNNQTQINVDEKKQDDELKHIEQQQLVDNKKEYYNAIKSTGQLARFKNPQSTEHMDRNDVAGSKESFATQQRSMDDIAENDRERFLRKGVMPGDYLPHTRQQALSKFEIKAGTLIPISLLTAISSEIPGYIVAQVRETVRDTRTGAFVLIPQGTKCLGTYTEATNGQTRASIVWTRLIYPDGSSLNLEEAPGVDTKGNTGVKDRVNNHYLRTYLSHIILGAAGAGYQFLSPDKKQNEALDTVASSVGQQLAQTSSEITRKNLNQPPTITVKSGFRCNILITRDLVLPPWQENSEK